MVTTNTIQPDDVRHVLDKVMDPEIPVLSVIDLGIIREISINNNHITIRITPTYSGCPAIDMIAMNIRMEMLAAGFTDVDVIQQLHPAWTTDWMTDNGKARLKAYGIAPPASNHHAACTDLFREEAVQCPHCNSWHTAVLSEFGSTACKSLYKCQDCLEPFDYFKCH